MSLKITPKYIRSQAQRDAYIFSTLVFLFTFFVTSYEVTLVPANKVYLFSLLKYSFSVLAFIFSFLLTYKPYNQVLIALTSLSLTFYSATGEYFAPLYHYAFVMCMLCISFLLRPNFKIFTPIVLSGQGLILYIQQYKLSNNLDFVREAAPIDYVMISIEFTLLIVIINEGYSKRRRNEIDHRERLSLLGQNINIFAHNIKNLFSSYYTLHDNILNNLEKPKELESIANEQGLILNDLNTYLREFNLLEKSEVSSFNVRESLNQTAMLLAIPKSSLDIKGESQLKCIKQDFISALINILSNAKKALMKIREENMTSKHSSKPKVNISLSEKQISIAIPFQENLESNTGVGDIFTHKLLRRNGLDLSIDHERSFYTYTIAKS